MILQPKNTAIAYRCPNCGKGIISMVGVFSLSGDMIKLKCDCGESELLIANTQDNKVRLTVPCVLCPKPHIYTVSKTLLYSDELFTLGCTYTGLDCCFIGSKDAVSDALHENEKQLLGLFEEAGVTSIDHLHKNTDYDTVDDPAIEEIIRFMLCELKDEGNIGCRCEDPEDADYTFEFVPPEYEKVRIRCNSCNAYSDIPMTSVASANAFLHIDKLELK